MYPSSFHLGHVHLPFYGICAALGLMGALVLSQVTARRVRLNPDIVWDAVVAIAIAALVISRALLMAGSFRFFLQQPLLVLALPTVNDTGLLLTTVFAMAYLRLKRLPLLRFLDAMAPCGAMLWGFLMLGRLAEGMREGMPTSSNGVQPVELYSLLAAAVLCAGLLRALRSGTPPGWTLGQGMASAGLAVFLLDFMRVPQELGGAGILDPVQWLGLATTVAGAALVIAVPATVQSGSADAV